MDHLEDFIIHAAHACQDARIAAPHGVHDPTLINAIREAIQDLKEIERQSSDD